MAAPLCGFFAVGGRFFSGGCFAAVGSWVPSLVDALLPRACGPSSWRMLCRHGRLVFVGGYFAAVAAGCSYVFYQSGCFATTALSIFRRPLRVFYCGLSCRSLVLRAVAILSSLLLFLCLFLCVISKTCTAPRRDSLRRL